MTTNWRFWGPSLIVGDLNSQCAIIEQKADFFLKTWDGDMCKTHVFPNLEDALAAGAAWWRVQRDAGGHDSADRIPWPCPVCGASPDHTVSDAGVVPAPGAVSHIPA